MRAVTLLSSVAAAGAVQQDVTVLLFDNKPQDGTSAPLEQQLRQGGWKWAQVGRVGKFEGFGQKIQAVQDAVSELPAETPVVVADAYDVLINSHPNAAQHASQKINALLQQHPGAVIVGAEGQCCVSALSRTQPGSLISDEGTRLARTCMSGADNCQWVPGGEKPWVSFMKNLAQQRQRGSDEKNAFLNAGIVAGRAGDIAMLYAAMQAEPTEDDQALMTELLYRRPEKFILDYDQSFFGNNRWSDGMSGCMYEPNSNTSRSEIKERDVVVVTDPIKTIDMPPFVSQTLREGQKGKLLRIDPAGFALLDLGDRSTVILAKESYSKLRVEQPMGALVNRDTHSAPVFLHTSGKFYECYRHLAGLLDVKPAETHYRKAKPLNYAPSTDAPQTADVTTLLQTDPSGVQTACQTALANLGITGSCTVDTAAPVTSAPITDVPTNSPSVDPLKLVTPGTALSGAATVTSTSGSASTGANVNIGGVADCLAATLQAQMDATLNAANVPSAVQDICKATPTACNLRAQCPAGSGTWYDYGKGTDVSSRKAQVLNNNIIVQFQLPAAPTEAPTAATSVPTAGLPSVTITSSDPNLCSIVNSNPQPHTCPTAHLAITVGAQNVCLDLTVCHTDTPTTNAGMSGDPFTSFDGKRTQFYLPIGVETKVIQCGTRAILGSTMPSGIPGDSQQWFQSIRVTNDGKDIALVRIAPAQSDASIRGNASYVDADDIQMRVQRALQKARSMADGDQTLKLLNVTIAGDAVHSVGTKVGPTWAVEVARDEPEIPGYGKTEKVTVSLGKDFELQINAAVAKKYISVAEQMEKLHLDMSFKDLRAEECSGLLPEIWGLKPMSRLTSQYLEPPNLSR